MAVGKAVAVKSGVMAKPALLGLGKAVLASGSTVLPFLIVGYVGVLLLKPRARNILVKPAIRS